MQADAREPHDTSVPKPGPPPMVVKQPVYSEPNIPVYHGTQRPIIGPPTADQSKPQVYMVKSDPKTYPFRAHIEANKHLDNDENRHKIQPVYYKMSDFKGKEHMMCDPSQLDKDGKYRVPKIMKEMEAKGFQTLNEYFDAQKKAKEDATTQQIQAQAQTINALQAQLAKQQEVLNAVVNHLNKSK